MGRNVLNQMNLVSYINFICECVCAFMWIPMKVRKQSPNPGAGVTDECEPPDTGAENQTPILWTSTKSS